MARIQCRERDITRRPRVWGEWELCDGTEGLTIVECRKLCKEWLRDDPKYTPWLQIDYRILEAGRPPEYHNHAN